MFCSHGQQCQALGGHFVRGARKGPGELPPEARCAGGERATLATLATLALGAQTLEEQRRDGDDRSADREPARGGAEAVPEAQARARRQLGLDV